MSERQMEDRSRSLHAALERMSQAREQRAGVVAPIDVLPHDLRDQAVRDRRNRLFRFSDRAMRAIGRRAGDDA